MTAKSTSTTTGAGQEQQQKKNQNEKDDDFHHDNNNNNNSYYIPFLCRFWRSLLIVTRKQATYMGMNRITRINGMDFSLTTVSAIVLCMIRYISIYIQTQFFQWPSYPAYHTINASASVVGIFHSMNLVPALFFCFLSHHYNPSESIDQVPHWYQMTVSALLQFCTGYMIYDGICNIILFKWDIGLSASDYMFLGHHIATALYMTSTRIVQAGHQSAMMCMFLGELTNPFHNAYYIVLAAEAVQICCTTSWYLQWIRTSIILSFTSLYCFIRAIVGPIVCGHMTWHLWYHKNPKIPYWLITIWTILIWGVILGSIPWIQDCWNLLTPYISGPTPSIQGTNEL